MLSFELSAIDVVLVIVAIVILLLYLKKPTQAKTESEPTVKEKEKEEVDINIPSVSEFKKAKTNSQSGSFKCSHHFEYLRNIPDGKSIPDECYICPRMMQCASGAKARERRNR